MVANQKFVPTKKKQKSVKDSLLVPVSKANVMIKGSVSKINRDLAMVRSMPLQDAMNYLMFSPYASSQAVAKLLKSAASNAFNAGLVKEMSQLVVSQIWANKSLQLKRMRAGSRGKPSPRKKTYSWVFVEMAVKQA